MTEELKMLLEQKRQIEQKIKQYKEQSISAGNIKGNATVKFGRTDYRHRPDEWFVAIWRNIIGQSVGVSQWQTVVRGQNKEQVIAEVSRMIADLQELEKKLKGEQI